MHSGHGMIYEMIGAEDKEADHKILLNSIDKNHLGHLSVQLSVFSLVKAIV